MFLVFLLSSFLQIFCITVTLIFFMFICSYYANVLLFHQFELQAVCLYHDVNITRNHNTNCILQYITSRYYHLDFLICMRINTLINPLFPGIILVIISASVVGIAIWSTVLLKCYKSFLSLSVTIMLVSFQLSYLMIYICIFIVS